MATQSCARSVPLAPIHRMLRHQLHAELVRLWRSPSFLVPSLVLPVLLFVTMGMNHTNGMEGGVRTPVYALTSVATFGIISVMLYSFGVGIANERAQRVNVLMRASPLPASVYLLAKVVTALISALVMLLALAGFASLVGGVRLSVSVWATLIVSLMLGVLPFLGLGLAVGQIVNPNGAVPMINIIYFVLSFASGVFAPLDELPTSLQRIAPYSPFYRLAQLARSAVGVQTGRIDVAVALLGLYALVFLAVATLAYRREEERTFG